MALSNEFLLKGVMPNVRRELASRRGSWLHKSAKSMYKATLNDWEKWRNHWKKSPR